MDFERNEKLAMVWAIQKVMFADGEISDHEKSYLNQLMKVFNFDFSFVEEAVKMDSSYALITLKNLTESKKNVVTVTMTQMAESDGNIDVREADIVLKLCKLIGWEN